jgi:hypothetical protein
MNDKINQRFEAMLGFISEIEKKLKEHSELKFIYDLCREMPEDRERWIAHTLLYERMCKAVEAVADVRRQVSQVIDDLKPEIPKEF